MFFFMSIHVNKIIEITKVKHLIPLTTVVLLSSGMTCTGGSTVPTTGHVGAEDVEGDVVIDIGPGDVTAEDVEEGDVVVTDV